MNEEETIAKAKIVPLKLISKIWILPVVALFVGGWMVLTNLYSKGPLIVITFSTADGIEEGKTKIKIKNVAIGLVKNIELNEDLETVSVTARINKHDSYLLNQDTNFWVVKPRIGRGGISGLGTLLSGAYIELSPGTSAKEKYQFKGLENEPVTPSGTQGLHISLETGAFGSLQVGDPILFHGLEVGRIEYVFFNTEKRIVYYDAFIESPHEELITSNIKFWAINGFNIELSAAGIQIQTGTLETIISGGVTFDVPTNMPRGELITERTVFRVYPNKGAIYDSQFKYAIQYILLFKDSIRGLKPGEPVEYRGIKIGSVTRTDIDYPEITNILEKGSLIPVMISIEPGRMGFEDSETTLPKVEKKIHELITKGLRGGLASGNLLTGSKYIELQYDEGVFNEPQSFDSHLVIPTLQSQFVQILNKVSKIMDKLYDLPLEPVINSADKTLQQLTTTLKDFRNTSQQLEILLKQSTDTNLVESIKQNLNSIGKLASDFSEGSSTHKELQNTLRYMKKTLKELESLLTQLNQKPNSLIFSDKKNTDMLPKGQ